MLRQEQELQCGHSFVRQKSKSSLGLCPDQPLDYRCPVYRLGILHRQDLGIIVTGHFPPTTPICALLTVYTLKGKPEKWL